MKLTPVNVLCPGVEEIDRLVFRVQSRSRQRKHNVDLEAKHGIGSCSCEDNSLNKNPDCHHLTQVRKYIAIKVAQAVIQSHQPK